jgi:hypothetical protein
LRWRLEAVDQSLKPVVRHKALVGLRENDPSWLVTADAVLNLARANEDTLMAGYVAQHWSVWLETEKNDIDEGVTAALVERMREGSTLPDAWAVGFRRECVLALGRLGDASVLAMVAGGLRPQADASMVDVWLRIVDEQQLFAHVLEVQYWAENGPEHVQVIALSILGRFPDAGSSVIVEKQMENESARIRKAARVAQRRIALRK